LDRKFIYTEKWGYGLQANIADGRVQIKCHMLQVSQVCGAFCLDLPIPDAEGRLRERDLQSLTALPVGDSATVREVHTDDSARLNRWKELGLVPGARCEMLEHREIEDVMRLRVSGREILTGSAGIFGVRIEKD